MRVQSLRWEDPLEGMAARSSILVENPVDRGTWQATVHGGPKKLDTTEATEHTHTHKDAIWTSTQPTSPSLPCNSFRAWDGKEVDLLVFSCTSTPYI